MICYSLDIIPGHHPDAQEKEKNLETTCDISLIVGLPVPILDLFAGGGGPASDPWRLNEGAGK